MSTIEVGEKIILPNGLQGIISQVSQETERVYEYLTGDSYPIGIAEYKVITVILTDGRSYRTKVRTGMVYSHNTHNTHNTHSTHINHTWQYGEI